MKVPITAATELAAQARLSQDAERWAAADEAYQAELEQRRANIIRAVRDDGLSLQTVGTAYGVTRQYIGRIMSQA